MFYPEIIKQKEEKRPVMFKTVLDYVKKHTGGINMLGFHQGAASTHFSDMMFMSPHHLMRSSLCPSSEFIYLIISEHKRGTVAAYS